MAGKRGRSGPKPKPTMLSIADGTHRPDRHGEIGEAVRADTHFEKPNFQCTYADALWEETIVPAMAAGYLTVLDAPLCRSVCELWGLYVMSYDIALSEPTDKDARIAVTNYWAKFEQAAARLGLNPCDRARLKIEKPKPTGIAARKRG